MKKKSTALLSLLLCCALLFTPAVHAAEAPDVDEPAPETAAPAFITGADLGFDLDINARAALLINADTNTVIYEKDAHERIHPASTTKIMSVALAMTLCDDLEGTIVTVPNDVWAEFEGLNVSHADLKAGEELPMIALLYCMMLQSANEASVALAAYFGREDFMRMMNEKAAELGCVDTNFSSPHGAFERDHYSTAYDLMLITQWALTVPGFWEMSQQPFYYKDATNKNEAETIVSTIKMQIPSSGYYTSYIRGIKTGTYEGLIDRCLISAAQKDGVTYLLVLMGTPMEPLTSIWTQGDSSFTETRRIYDWAFANLRLQNVVDGGTALAEIPLRYAAGRDALLLYPGSELFAIQHKEDESGRTLHYVYNLPEEIKAPVEAGDIIGTATVYYGDPETDAGAYALGTIDLVARESISRNVFVMAMDLMGTLLSSTVAKVIYALLFVVALIYCYYMLVVVRLARKKQRKKKKQQSPRR